jgi:hypothetical protein
VRAALPLSRREKHKTLTLRNPDPDKFSNAGLGGNMWCPLDLFEGDKTNARALKNLVRAAIDYNQIKLKSKPPAGTRAKVHKSKKG